jgi:hypothetical protein
MDESVLPGTEAPSALPEMSPLEALERPGNPQLNRSAEALGRGMGNAVAGVKRLPGQFGRLRSKIHLVNPKDTSELLTRSGEVGGEWRDALESGVAQAAGTARTYRSIMADLANRQMLELRERSERRYFALRRDLRHRLDKISRMSSEEPLQFIARCAGAAFVMGVALRVWRSNHE